MKLSLLLLMAAAAWSQVTPTTITDTLRVPVAGGLFRGVVRITPPNVLCGGASYKPVPAAVQVTNGVFSVSLVPNSQCQPAGTHYQVRYESSTGARWEESWSVPVSQTPITLADVYIGIGGGSSPGSGPVDWNDVLNKPSTFPPASHSHPDATTQASGFMSASDKVKLNAIETGATANQTDAHLLNRANHTGTQAISTVNGLQQALDGKEPAFATLAPSKGGFGADVSGFDGVVRFQGGAASVVPGDQQDCVRVDGSSGPCGTGGAGGSTGGGMVKEFADAATTWTFEAGEHLYASCHFDVVTWRQSGDYIEILQHSNARCQTAAGEGQYDVVVEFQDAQAGFMALIPGGAPAGAQNLVVALDAVSTVDVTHNYGTKGILVAVYDDQDRSVEPDTVTHVSSNSLRITFASPHTGFAALNRAGWSGTPEGEGDPPLTTVAAGDGLLGVGTPADPLRVNPATVPSWFTESATLNDWGTIGAQSCVQKTFAMPGAVSNDSVIPRWPAGLPAGLAGVVFVSSADTIAVRLCNPTGSGVAVANGNMFGATILRSF